MEISRHFTVTIYIVHKDKALLHKHAKLGIWIPVGGHIDINETPEEAALREAKEESGLDVKLYNDKKDLNLKGYMLLNSGQYFNLHNINEYHQHIDFAFFASADSYDLNPDEKEKGELKWFAKEEIEKDQRLKEDVKILALQALKILS